MITIDNLEALDPLVMRHIERQIAERQIASPDDAIGGLEFTRAAMLRAALYFRRFISNEDRHVDSAGQAFGFAWMLAEREALRRVMTAITSPGARGREAEVVQALMNGASITEAVAKRESAPVTKSGGVVAFPSRRVTSTATNE